MKKNYYYPAVFTYEDEKDIAITFPDFPGCVSCASDEEQAVVMAKEALGGHIWCMEEDGDEIPAPTPLKDVDLASGETATIIHVFMPAITMAQVNKSVNRTVTLPAWMNAKALEAGLNFSQVLQEALMNKLVQ